MPFTLIKGTYHVVGYSPDGDSIKFKAANSNNWKKISGKPKLNSKGHVQLRFEAIDALETHYRPPAKGATEEHQPTALAQAARDLLFASLGITNVKWGPTGSRVTSADEGGKGYILTRSVDNNKFGRPVSFVFAGIPAERDGSSITLDTNRVKQSINYKLLKSGLVYPTYYSTLFSDLRNEMTKACKKARSSGKGLWPKDKTMRLTFKNKKSITDDYPILPKLFRRLVEHLAKSGTLKSFKTFLAREKDGVLILPQANHTDALDFVVNVKGKQLSLTTEPENLVFDT
jgi:endonuclease YncB( thermonuclease family)